MLTFQKLGRYGRLGNQMFQVASTIGIARKRGYEVGFPKWENHDAKILFGSKEDLGVGEWFPKFKEYPYVFDGQYLEYFIPWGFHGFDVPDDVSLVGHMQSEKYFEHCADEIRDLFTMQDEPDTIPYTAIHVRMGDYGSSYHPICDQAYYQKAVRHLEGPYMIFSDEPQKALNYLQPIVGYNIDLVDADTKTSFAMMKRCKAHIIANSTFSWWAAWLAGTPTVAPKTWFGPDAAQLETKDIYPSTWTIL